MTKDYKEYLQSAAWIAKKAELATHFLKHNWKICCTFCGSTQKLHVHHWRYDNIKNESVENGDIDFACADCHKSWHFDPIFKKEWLEVS